MNRHRLDVAAMREVSTTEPTPAGPSLTWHPAGADKFLAYCGGVIIGSVQRLWWLSRWRWRWQCIGSDVFPACRSGKTETLYAARMAVGDHFAQFIARAGLEVRHG